MIFIIWTTFVCLNGEILNDPFWTAHMSSSNFYTNMVEVNKEKDKWRSQFKWNCAPFMIQHEDVTNQLLLKDLLNIRF